MGVLDGKVAVITGKAKTSHVLMPIFCIAYSQSVPIFREVPSSSG